MRKSLNLSSDEHFGQCRDITIPLEYGASLLNTPIIYDLGRRSSVTYLIGTLAAIIKKCEPQRRRAEQMPHRMTLKQAFRRTERPMLKEIAAQMLLERALDVNDMKLLTLMVRRVGSALRHQRDRENAISTDGPGNYQLWVINR